MSWRRARNRSPRCSPLAGAALTLALAVLLASGAGAESITGICPDGSIFIVRHPSKIPCRESKLVEPHEVPPIRPELLPTPYTWQVYSKEQDPNNPYNLIDSVRQLRGKGPGVHPNTGPAPGQPGPTPPPPVAAGPARAPTSPLDLGLSDAELRDLYLIVDFSQERQPASLRRETADGRGVLEVRFAYSQAFTARLQQAWASRGGLAGGQEVLLFTVGSEQAAEFHANFTVIQDHLSFSPDATNARQLGLLQGRLGALEPGLLTLGYLVLPDSIDLSRPFDLYWNDRRIELDFSR